MRSVAASARGSARAAGRRSRSSGVGGTAARSSPRDEERSASRKPGQRARTSRPGRARCRRSRRRARGCCGSARPPARAASRSPRTSARRRARASRPRAAGGAARRAGLAALRRAAAGGRPRPTAPRRARAGPPTSPGTTPAARRASSGRRCPRPRRARPACAPARPGSSRSRAASGALGVPGRQLDVALAEQRLAPHDRAHVGLQRRVARLDLDRRPSCSPPARSSAKTLPDRHARDAHVGLLGQQRRLGQQDRHAVALGLERHRPAERPATGTAAARSTTARTAPRSRSGPL